MSIQKEKNRGGKRQPWLFHLLNIAYSLSTKVTISCLVLMVSLVVVDVCGRSVSGSGLSGTVEMNEYLLIILGFIGIIQTHHTKGHVGVDLLFKKFSDSTQVGVERFNNLLILIFSLFFCYAGIIRSVTAFQSGETNWFGQYVIPVWYIRIVVPISCVVLCTQSVYNIWKPQVRIGE